MIFNQFCRTRDRHLVYRLKEDQTCTILDIRIHDRHQLKIVLGVNMDQHHREDQWEETEDHHSFMTEDMVIEDIKIDHMDHVTMANHIVDHVTMDIHMHHPVINMAHATDMAAVIVRRCTIVITHDHHQEEEDTTEDRRHVEDIREMTEEIDHLLDIKIIDITDDKYFDFFKLFFCTYYRQLMFGATQLPSSKLNHMNIT